MKPATPQLLKLAEVARRLDQSVKTVRRRIAAREIQAVKLSSRALRVEDRELERYLATKRI